MTPLSTRQFPRKPLEGFATIAIPASDKQVSVPIEIISKKGIGVFSKEKIARGTKVSLKLYYTLGDKPLESSFNGVVTGEEIKDKFGVINIVFEGEINPADHEELFHYLETV